MPGWFSVISITGARATLSSLAGARFSSSATRKDRRDGSRAAASILGNAEIAGCFRWLDARRQKNHFDCTVGRRGHGDAPGGAPTVQIARKAGTVDIVLIDAGQLLSCAVAVILEAARLRRLRCPFHRLRVTGEVGLSRYFGVPGLVIASFPRVVRDQE